MQSQRESTAQFADAPIAPVTESNAAAIKRAEEQAIVQRAADGDKEAFSTLVDRYYRRALGLAIGILKSREDAEDVVQEAFVRVHRRLPEFRAASGFYTWLYRIVVNLSIDQQRKRRRERRADVADQDVRDAMSQGDELWPNPEHHNPVFTVHCQQLRERIYSAFNALPDIHKSVIMLREVEHLSYEEISEALEIKKGTVMSRLFHARRAMQELLAQELPDFNLQQLALAPAA